MRKNRFAILCFGAWMLFSGWGYTGHFIISQNSSACVVDSIPGYGAWATYIALHSSDADNRKSMDNTEGPKHYIDVDNYPEFKLNGLIHSSFDSIKNLHGEAFVLEQGILPWATLAAYDSLTANLKRKNWANAKLWAADLSHYVADGHMPLHITTNYDGQLTGNKGIHSRYESKMIGQFSTSIVAQKAPIFYVSDAPNFIFNYIYANYSYVDSLLVADTEATRIAGNTQSSAYYNALWEKTAAITINLFNDATSAFSNLFYSAWIDAGMPVLDSESEFSSVEIIPFDFLRVYPNPVDSMLQVHFNLRNAGNYRIDLHDWEGRVVRNIVKGNSDAGDYKLSIDVTEIPAGQYFLIIHGARYSATERILKK